MDEELRFLTKPDFRKGDGFIGKAGTEIEGRTGVIHKVKSWGRLVLIFDDEPTIKQHGYLDEEIDYYE